MDMDARGTSTCAKSAARVPSQTHGLQLSCQGQGSKLGVVLGLTTGQAAPEALVAALPGQLRTSQQQIGQHLRHELAGVRQLRSHTLAVSLTVWTMMMLRSFHVASLVRGEEPQLMMQCSFHAVSVVRSEELQLMGMNCRCGLHRGISA
jgi:hypothetical protein